MRNFLTPVLFCAVFAVCGVSAATAATPSTSSRANEAGEQLEAARLLLKIYERVDYPLRLRQLASEIKLAQARVDSYRRRVAEYERYQGSKAIFVSLEDTRLQLLAAQLRLKDLEQERVLLQKHNRDERRLRQLLIKQAESRVESLR